MQCPEPVFAMQEAYRHFYHCEPPPITSSSFPLDTLFSDISSSWARAIHSVAQSPHPRQCIKIGTVEITFDAEICFIRVSPRTCYVVPYTMILCFSDMCAAWFTVDCYCWIHNDKYPGQSLSYKYRTCLNH
ncbi:unnamed protein product, partial [Brenthis ino]